MHSGNLTTTQHDETDRTQLQNALVLWQACCFVAHCCLAYVPPLLMLLLLLLPGEGKPKMKDEKETTVYKRALDVEYKLKLKASRAVFSEINRKFPAMPFTLRAITGGTTLFAYTHATAVMRIFLT